eukprot:augustus_masked-scaffold_83-processed-gene-0.5-mRNA-1 protein AED:0.02 eAED:0.02 QI:0/-1/0/1/-1/1/1/0/272
MSTQNKNEENLDDILNSALDDLDLDNDENDNNPKDSAETIRNAAETSRNLQEESLENLKKTLDTENVSLEDSFASLMKDMNNPEFTKDLENAMKVLNSDPDADILKELGESGDPGFAEMMKKLTSAASSNDVENMGEDMMQKMLGEFENLSQKEGFQDQIDKMMAKVVSKEVMYEPIKAVSEEFPAFLAEFKDKKSENYQNYGKQYQYFQQIVGVYETEPENSEKLMKLMQELQEFGNPPQEILEKVAPGAGLNPLLNMPGGKDGVPDCPQM